jgi:hypothetical protein
MKKVFKVIGLVLLVIVGLIVLQFIKAALTPAAPNNYTETVKAGGDIERTYLRNGSHKVSYFEQKVDEDFEKYEVWYPEDLENSDDTYPLIVVLNGTGVKASKYKAQFEHFASWGFVVIGTEEPESWDGVAAESSLAFMLEQNEDSSSIFYHKIDTDNIGAVGHSQGGAGVFNAITEHEHSGMYKTAVPVSPTNEEQTAALGWHYDLSKVSVPVLLLAGTKGDFEMKYVIPEESMIEMYNKISAPKVMARKLDCEHGDMLYGADGYITAWFMWRLQGDKSAAKAFAGDSPEIADNSLYIEQKIDLE